MTDDEKRKLGERWRACKHFRWMPGMCDLLGHRVTAVWEVMGVLTASGRLRDDAIPDPTDDATKGCLLAQVREAWGCSHMCAQLCEQDNVTSDHGPHTAWAVFIPGTGTPDDPESQTVFTGPTEAEALVKAFEAAP